MDIDTSFFSGNQPAQASLQACFSKKNPTKNTNWKTILKKKRLGPDQNHNFKIKNIEIFDQFPNTKHLEIVSLLTQK